MYHVSHCKIFGLDSNFEFQNLVIELRSKDYSFITNFTLSFVDEVKRIFILIYDINIIIMDIYEFFCNINFNIFQND